MAPVGPQRHRKQNKLIIFILLKILLCAYSRLFSQFLKRDICALCSETIYSSNRRSTAVETFGFTADARYVKYVHRTIFCLEFSLSAHLAK